MAYLSKVQVNGKTYDIKDAKSRTELSALLNGHTVEALGAAAWKAVAANISGEGLVDASVVKDYVDSQVGNVHSFDVVIDASGTEAGPSVTASADTMYKIYMVADTKASAGTYIEWITIRSGEVDAYTYNWEKIGSTKTDLTGYVSKDTTIATIALDHSITTEELQTALKLGKLALKDSATGTVNDYATGITGASYTPEGSVAVELSQTSTVMESTGTFKPTGTVTGTTTAAGNVAIEKSTTGTKITGTVSAPTITVTPNTAQVQYIDSVGTLPSYSAAKYTPPSVNESKQQFATAGVTATMAGDDGETLVITNAGTADALTGTGFNAGSYEAASFNAGKLPTLGTAQTVVTGIATATASAPVFTGDKFAATFTGTEAAISATFAGTDEAVTVRGNYDKAGVKSTEFTGTAATITPTLDKGSKTITVE